MTDTTAQDPAALLAAARMAVEFCEARLRRNAATQPMKPACGIVDTAQAADLLERIVRANLANDEAGMNDALAAGEEYLAHAGDVQAYQSAYNRWQHECALIHDDLAEARKAGEYYSEMIRREGGVI